MRGIRAVRNERTPFLRHMPRDVGMQIRYADAVSRSTPSTPSAIIITGLLFYPSMPKLDEIGIKFRSINDTTNGYRSNRMGKYSIGRKFRIAITDNRIYDSDSPRKESLSHPIEQTSLCKPGERYPGERKLATMATFLSVSIHFRPFSRATLPSISQLGIRDKPHIYISGPDIASNEKRYCE